MMKKLILSLDFMGITPFMSIQGNYCYKSTLGGIISILVILSITALGLYFSVLFATRSSFTLYTNNSKTTNSTRFWGHDDFSIIVLDKYFNEIPHSDRIFQIYADIWTDKRITNKDGTVKSETVIIPVELERCNIASFKNKELWRDEKLINQSTCFSPNVEEKKVNSTGTYGATGYTGVVFWIHLCMNSTKKKNCYPLDESKKILENIFVYVKFSDYYFNHNSISEYAIPYIYSELIQGSATSYKRQWYLFQKTKYVTDAGILFDAPKTKEFTTFSSTYNSIDLRTNTTIENTFLAISLNMEDSELIINKRYYKIQNLFADLGGIIKVISMIGGALDYLCSCNLYFLELINSNLHNYIPVEDKKTETSPNSTLHMKPSEKSISKFIKPLNSSSSKQNLRMTQVKVLNNRQQSTIINKSENISIYINGIGTKYTKKVKKVELKLYQLVNVLLFFYPQRYFKSRDKNKKIYLRLQMIIYKQIDISNIIKSINLLDKMSLSLIGIQNYPQFERCFNPLSIFKQTNKYSNMFYPNECISLDNLIARTIKEKIKE